MTTQHMNRQPQGIPAGGQFAATPHSENDSVTLPAPAQPAFPAAAAFELGKAGLQGELSQYTGGNPDAPEGAMAYVSPAGHELVLSGVGTDTLMIQHFDPTEENTFTTERSGCKDPAKAVAAIEDVLWDLEAQDSFSAGFADGDVYEIREVELGRDADGTNRAMIIVRDEDDNELTVSHNYDTGTTTFTSDYGDLDGLAEEAALDSIVVDMAEEVEGGDNNLAIRRAFERVRAAALRSPGAAGRLTPLARTELQQKMLEHSEAIKSDNWQLTTQQARNITVAQVSARLGQGYAEAARTNTPGRENSAAMYAISAAALAPLSGKLADCYSDTEAARAHIRETRETLSGNTSMLDAYAPGGRQPIFKEVDEHLKDLDGFISGP
ncbi:hypothetical protein [Arthrobacter sp. IK3]|uniref:hypothetical protein n=1 Tax=Arthrobacter sp. IK3 TaxID=3448169 RepID=UPI003EE33E7A